MTYQVLVVDDDPVVSMLVTALLTRAGWKPTSVTNAQDALEHLARSNVDLVITDVNMPGMTGLELRERVRENPERVGLPVVLLTATPADVTTVDDPRTLLVGKPVRPASFVAELRTWIAGLG